jgi:hypothetical protein
MKHAKKSLIALFVLAASVSAGLAYTKPTTYRPYKFSCSDPTDLTTCTFLPGSIVFGTEVPRSPHSWAIPKAIELLRKDGFVSEANLAQKHVLPMLEGVTFNDVRGDADMAGASVLDYDIPDSPQTNSGYGCVLNGFGHTPCKNCTNSFSFPPSSTSGSTCTRSMATES